jgi:hypothetical protein
MGIRLGRAALFALGAGTLTLTAGCGGQVGGAASGAMDADVDGLVVPEDASDVTDASTGGDSGDGAAATQDAADDIRWIAPPYGHPALNASPFDVSEGDGAADGGGDGGGD